MLRRFASFILAIFFLTVISGSDGILQAGQPLSLQPGDEYGGGVVGYILQPNDPGFVAGEQHGLVISRGTLSYAKVYGKNPPDISDYSFTDANTVKFKYRWSTSVTEDSLSVHYAFKPVGTSTAFGTGRENTRAILAVYPKSLYKYTAAALCDDYSVTLDGLTYDDWYLPSIDELERLAKHQDVLDSFAINNVIWSSSEDSPAGAWNYYLFRNHADIRDNVNKSGSSSVFAVRNF